MSIIRTLDRSTEHEVNNFKLRPSGVLKAWPATPLYVGAGSATTSTTVAWPADAVTKDLGILVVECSGADTAASASGWTHFTGSPVVDVADATGSKLSVMWKFAENNSPASASVTGPTDHLVSRMVVFRNVSVVPGRVTATDTKTTASTTVTWPSITTASPNNMVVFAASRPDDSSSTTTFSAFTAAGLTSPTEAGEAGTTSGNGGGFVICYGTRAAIGSIGTSTATSSVSTTNALLVVALEPTVALPA